MHSKITIVSGLWNIDRKGRDFSHYISLFDKFLDIPHNMVLFLPEELEEVVWKKRKTSNTKIISCSLDDIEKNYYAPFWDKTQEIRTSNVWKNQLGQNSWLTKSPQADNKFYNPIVQSKMFMVHDSKIWNHFNSEYFYWLDAGIMNTVPYDHLVTKDVISEFPKFSNPFLFLSYPYNTDTEIHGFDINEMKQFSGGKKVINVCRGGIFGGHIDQLSDANADYYHLLESSLNKNLMGTEESIFSIMATIKPYVYRRFQLNKDGLCGTFTGSIIDGNTELVSVDKKIAEKYRKNPPVNFEKIKTNLYILTFNFPKQLEHTLESMRKVPEWLEKPNLFLLDNSDDEKAKKRNQEIAKENGFEYIDNGGNIGINRGRQVAAEHFHNSDADYYFFFEDDMTSNSSEEEGNFCRNGLRKWIPNLYEIAHKIIIKEKFDFLKLSFTEVYWDNNIQTSWYNVPQEVRTKYWPDYDRLPIQGRDPNHPRTEFNKIDNIDGVAYINGEVTYTNWPMIMSKEGNKKVFIDKIWAHPYEQTWMSNVYQLQKEGKINAAVLLASPIWHERIQFYKKDERREN